MKPVVLGLEEFVTVLLPVTSLVVDESELNTAQELRGGIHVYTDFKRPDLYEIEFILAKDEHDVLGPGFSESLVPLKNRFISYALSRIELFAEDAKMEFDLNLASIVLSALDINRDEEVAHHLSHWIAHYIANNFHILVHLGRHPDNLDLILATLITTFQPNAEMRQFEFIFRISEQHRKAFSEEELQEYFELLHP